MKILVVGNGSIGNHLNKEFYINNHTGEFLKEVGCKHQVLFVQNITKYDKNNDLQNFDMIKEGIDFSYIKNNKSLVSIVKLIRLLLKADFVYLFYPGTLSRITSILLIVLRKRFGLYVRGQYYLQYSFDKIILKHAEFILTVSPFFKKQLNNDCRNIQVIKPMISIKKEDINYLRKYSIPEKWNLLFVGRVEYRKGINELIETSKYLKKLNLNFELNIVGGGDLYSSIKEMIIRDKLNNYVKLHGQVSNKHKLTEFYKNADAFVFTSHDEGFPRVLYEAMASGLPMFTTFVGGIPGRMKNGKNCIEIPLQNSMETAKIIFESLNNLEVLKEIGINGRQTLLDILNGNYFPHEKLLLKNLKS